MNNYIYTDETNDKMSLAFSKDKSDERKKWLYSFDENNILDHNESNVPIQDFIDRELIHFSNSDTLRSIGSLYDGLKDFLDYVDRDECPPVTKADLPFLKYFL